MNKGQKRTVTVLKRMLKMARENPEDAQAFSDVLEEGLNELANNDCFGTEGQCDPRGDFRDGRWTMDRVQGVDTKIHDEEEE